jgi:hypothetical protein
MRTWLLLATIMTCGYLSGCKTAEIAVDHQMTGIHVVAKFEGKEEAVASDASEDPDGEAKGAAQVAERTNSITR